MHWLDGQLGNFDSAEVKRNLGRSSREKRRLQSG
nr:MAG TPA: hypothetical protein [Bacteriophage sp.]